MDWCVAILLFIFFIVAMFITIYATVVFREAGLPEWVIVLFTVAAAVITSIIIIYVYETCRQQGTAMST